MKSPILKKNMIINFILMLWNTPPYSLLKFHIIWITDVLSIVGHSPLLGEKKAVFFLY